MVFGIVAFTVVPEINAGVIVADCLNVEPAARPPTVKAVCVTVLLAGNIAALGNSFVIAENNPLVNFSPPFAIVPMGKKARTSSGLS